MRRFILLLTILALSLSMTSCKSLGLGTDREDSLSETQGPSGLEATDDISDKIDENGSYTSKEDVALYIYTYDRLPENFISKKEAMDLGWDSSKGNLWEVTDKKSIGGDRFGNREGLLPKLKGRQYFECDINYQGGFRGAERLVYSNDGLIYYTGDHYKTFNLLYGDE